MDIYYIKSEMITEPNNKNIVTISIKINFTDKNKMSNFHTDIMKVIEYFKENS